MIAVAVGKDINLPAPPGPTMYPTTTIAMNTPLARIMQRTERKATINLPPSSPSRGPRGRMVLITP